ncbi:MAG: hypothetical protein JNL21_40390 [Myxococcales bacterium]|nr:hypothetical protein [Myxococcales bacterium]
MSRSRMVHGAALLWSAAALAACTFEVPAPYGSGGSADGGNGGEGGTGGVLTTSQTTTTGTSSTTSTSTTTSGATTTGPGCVAPEAECPGEEGCFEILSDPDHCGAGCEKCLPNGSCFDGFCGCSADQIECSNPPGCYDPSSSDDHCGDCNTACSPTEDCSEGHCCPSGEEYCVSPTPGCYPTQTDIQHCGSCTNSCGSNEVCNGGQCECAGGLHACPLQMGCFSDTSTSHCGPTCAQCGANEACVDGSCECLPGLTDCNGVCLNLQTNGDNCGACGNTCSTAAFPGASCSSGHCQKAGLSPGIGVIRGFAADDSTTPTTLYAITVDSTIWRFGDGFMPADSASQPLNAVFGRLFMDASMGGLSYGFSVQTTGGLHSGSWGSLPSVVTSSTGFTTIARFGSTLYWGADKCVRKTPASPVDLLCFTTDYPTTLVQHPTDATDAFVHPISSSGTQGHIRRFDLNGAGQSAQYTTFPIAQRTEDSLRSFATDGTGDTLYFFTLGSMSGEIELRRYDIATSSAQALFVYSGDAIPVSILRDGATLYWIWRTAGGTVEIRRAPTTALNVISTPNPPGVAELLSSFTVSTNLPAVSDLHQDAEALYFVADNTVYRLAK